MKTIEMPLMNIVLKIKPNIRQLGEVYELKTKNMITEKEYLDAKNIVQEYEKGIWTMDDIRKMSINTTCPSEEELSKLRQGAVSDTVCDCIHLNCKFRNSELCMTKHCADYKQTDR